ncbi:DUF2235 domain-containing protein [Cedecea sp. FDAARGOS_727]|uniref:T6SS phospholipase effector Tle1-like catalytic domain-containing protein n=1 Tax=Cedecea sp. FDAARGOS_727 TaxID=2545798 RepID=UPI00143EAD6F|nr:DUF2235 domain-containing protein [Cedecea sp. FDAARGOS_727]QIX97568.1 DUF2235 domain-containing protein [Cedecea sp. FDAARGOS_727]
MPKVTTDLAWYPPPFPAQGRLPSRAALIGANCKKQASMEREYRDSLCEAADRVVELPCCKTLHISLFFDGTGNNLNNDFYLSNPKHPTNIARLFRASIGNGTAGGVSNTGGLFDSDSSLKGSYFKYYIPGVGTPFPEINDLDYSLRGLAFADRGEDRINWGLLRIIDALKRSLSKSNTDSSKLSDGETRDALKNMATSMASFGLTGSHNRYEEFSSQLKKLEKELGTALQPPNPGQPKLLGVKLYIYGFSRGAAAARTFVRWLSELLPKPEKGKQKPDQCLAVGNLKIPLSVEFLGLLDTVASVGAAHILPLAEGHMSWADDTQELPDEKTYGGFIKDCVHLVSAHEQRLCFPLDSIRRSNGKYPANSVEVIYPGMHSDIGGGYPPGDQGKANGKNDGYLLSQIILQDLYSLAFKSGAPLKVMKQALPPNLVSNKWRVMPFDLASEFYISEILINRFNAWRELTLNQPLSKEPVTDEQAAKYEAPRATVSLEKAVQNQLAWITAWRINRYARGTMLGTHFYKDASEKHGVSGVLKEAEVRRELEQGAVRARRKNMLDNTPPEKIKDLVLEPGIKDFDPEVSKTQLQQAAQEFGEDYRGEFRSVQSLPQLVLDVIPRNAIFMMNSDDERQDFATMKREGEDKVRVLFPLLGEESNADQPGGLVRALFDDQVHDSRAWFMHYALEGRELWSGYFRYRMIYFGRECSKSLSPLAIAGNVVGAATLVGGVIFSFRQKGTTAKLAGLAGTAGIFSLESEALDLLTGLPIAMSPDAAKLKAFTPQPGVVVAEQTAAVQEQRLAFAKSIIHSEWAKEAASTLIS